MAPTAAADPIADTNSRNVSSAVSSKSPKSRTNAKDEAQSKSPKEFEVTLNCEGHASIVLRFNTYMKEKEVKTLISRGFGFSSEQEFYVVSGSEYVFAQLHGSYMQYHSELKVIKESLKIKTAPAPPTVPIIGNALELASDWISTSLAFHEKYGSFIKVKIFSKVGSSITDADIVEKLIYESPFFQKQITNILLEIKRIGGSGLFTTASTETEWSLANKLLKPAFGFTPLKGFIPIMHDVTMKLCSVFDQLVGKPIHITSWFTKFAFTTIGLCGFGYDFHLLDSAENILHPFTEAMIYTLSQSLVRTFSPRLKNSLTLISNYKFSQAVALMQNTVDSVIESRKSNPDPKKKDFMNFMLNSKDEHGNTMDSILIRDQVLTFLIAGHETTANLLTWCTWLVSEHPDVEARLLEEAIRVCGPDPKKPITADEISKLQYTTQVLKETLRLYPPVPAIIKDCTTPTVLGDGYLIEKDEQMTIFCVGLHRNPTYWGKVPNIFNPDNFSPENEKKRHKFAYLPFSLGERSCIGISFALQESKMALAILVRRYQFERVGMGSVTFNPKSLTLQPLNLQMRLQLRGHVDVTKVSSLLNVNSSINSHLAAPLTPFKPNGSFPPIVFHYGSDMGTSEDFARQMYQTAKNYHIETVEVKTLDSQLQFHPEAIHVIIVSTYNGAPPANAKEFKEFISSAPPDTMKNVKYAVYGCGNSQWRTFQKIPMLVDYQMETLGGIRIMPLGSGDANGDIEAHFFAWQAKFWIMLQKEYDISLDKEEIHPLLNSARSSVIISEMNKVTTTSDTAYMKPANLLTPDTGFQAIVKAKDGVSEEVEKKSLYRGESWTVVLNQELIQPVPDLPEKSVHHFILSGTSPYAPGDHFELWPENSVSDVSAIAALVQYDLEAVIKIENATAPSKSVAFQVKGSLSVKECFQNFCDFLGPPLKHLIETLLEKQGKPEESMKIRTQDIALYQQYVSLYPRALDVFLKSNVPWSLAEVVCGCNKITPRLYSIASSRDSSGDTVHLCASLNSIGFCSQFLKNLQPGATLYASVRPAPDFFHLPSDPKIPIVLVCAGTGISPFRGFLQARAKLQDRGELHFFYGCRHPHHDYLFASELQKYKEEGVITALHVAFSRYAGAKEGKYVQDSIKLQQEKIAEFLSPQSNAVFYICGSAKGMAKDLTVTFEEILYTRMSASVVTDIESIKKYMSTLRDQNRYIEDVWG